ncbi:MAG: plastocyanin/azurin family copper-binding protein [Gammaproteobacteria bacterium]|nr:plastocyanin/azurin family copper-binding protein [Gammaproteobacteria bacterium]
MHIKSALIATASLWMLGLGNAFAEEVTVTAQATAYEPIVVFIQPGDTVKWTNMSGHNTASLDGLIPEGGEPWDSALGDNYSQKFEVEGVYIYKCTPHYSLGMAGAIVVGQPTNFEQVKQNATGMAMRVVAKTNKALDQRAAAK